MKKRIMSVAFIFALVLALCLAAAPSASASSGSIFTIENGVLTRYNGSGGAVTIPNTVTKIGDNAFSNCTSLTRVTIPDSVTRIEISILSFQNCASLTEIRVDANNPYYASVDGVLFNRDKTVLLTYPRGRQGAYTIPDSVTSIDHYAFKDCTGLTSVTIPDSVTSIGWNAFKDCTGLTRVTIPNRVTEINYGAFEGCTGLTSVTISDSVPAIDQYAFKDCTGLTSVTIPNRVTKIDYGAFGGCTGLTTVINKSYVLNSVDSSAFPDGVKIYGVKSNALKSYEFIPNPGGFTDVYAYQWYGDAVEWAVAAGITNGTGNNMFSPHRNCTHAQILTFLWRAADSPASSAQPPITMKGDEYYYDAAKWAAEKGMIDKNFNPDAPCNRADAVRYIWYAFGKPAVSYDGRFTDVTANAGYAQAVAWAVEKEITNGTGDGQFSPGAICNRGQIATFLYRAYNAGK